MIHETLLTTDGQGTLRPQLAQSWNGSHDARRFEVELRPDICFSDGSALRAIDRAREFGLEVQGALAIVDRLAGGEAAFKEKGVTLRTLLTIRDFGLE